MSYHCNRSIFMSMRFISRHSHYGNAKIDSKHVNDAKSKKCQPSNHIASLHWLLIPSPINEKNDLVSNKYVFKQIKLSLSRKNKRKILLFLPRGASWVGWRLKTNLIPQSSSLACSYSIRNYDVFAKKVFS